MMVASKNEQVEQLQCMLEMQEERMKELESIQKRNHVLVCNFMMCFIYRIYNSTINNY